jgi:hypothetical protein
MSPASSESNDEPCKTLAEADDKLAAFFMLVS